MFSVHSHKDSGMPPRALVATREDAARAAGGLGIAPEDLHVEAVLIEDLRRVAHAMCGGGSERPVREPRPAVHHPELAAKPSDPTSEAA